MMIGCGTYEENSRGRTGGVFIVLEYMEKGSLDSLVWDNDGSLRWDTRLQLMEDVSEGMAYLHGVHRSIHRDLKTPNVLLCEESGVLRAKVGDFGLARILGGGGVGKSEGEKETKSIRGFISKRLKQSKKSSKEEESKESSSDEALSSSMTCGAGTYFLWEMFFSFFFLLHIHILYYITGTSLWMAPELVETIQLEKEGQYEASYSQAVDIYAFGTCISLKLCSLSSFSLFLTD